jgi:CTP synthase (UTP-ammonia lyase)
MIQVCRYARENLIPYFGICLGMQIAVIEFCRNMLGLPKAHSREFDEETTDDVITTMDDVSYQQLGGTLRKGAKKTFIKSTDSLAYKIYGSQEIMERHRHRYEVNPNYIKRCEEKGLIFSGKDPDSERMSIAEIPNHPFFFCTQYHPEFKTNPFKPTPIFYSFMLASSKQYDKLRTYFQNHIPGVSVLESDEDSDIGSSDEQYDKMMKIILNNSKIFKDIMTTNKSLEKMSLTTEDSEDKTSKD